MIYLDNNATTRPDPEVLAALREAEGLFGNPSSIHSEGRRARRAIEESRDEGARLVGARPEEIFFTSGGTEANALAVFGAAETRPGPIVRSAAEHPSVRGPFEALGAAGRAEVVVRLEPTGELDPDRFAAAIPEGAALVSVMTANNEYGGLFPVEAIAAAARARGALVHTDAVQAAGRIELDVRRLGVDLATLSAHKLHGPRGAGALFVRRGVALVPRAPGGGQEKGLRAGTENTAAIVGFGVAARLARERVVREAPRIASLRDRFEREVCAKVPGARAVGARGPRLPNTSAILFPGIPGDALLFRLDLEGIAASTGSACSSGTLEPARSILALGLPRSEARSVLRFSLSRETTAEEIETAVRVIEAAAAGARAGVAEVSRRA